MSVGFERAGLVLAVGGDDADAPRSTLLPGRRMFVSASEARVIVELRAHTMVDQALGIGIGVAAVTGKLATLLDLDPTRTGAGDKSNRHAVLCELDSGEGILLVGVSVLATGLFAEEAGPTVAFESERLEIFSVANLYRKVEMRIWESRALSPHTRPPASRRSDGRSA